MNAIWAFIIIFSIAYVIVWNGNADIVNGMLRASKDSIFLLLTLTSVCAVFNGILHILNQIKWLEALQKNLSPAIKKFFPRTDRAPGARAHIAANIAANMLGMGNAATPAGLAAVKEMAGIPGATGDIAMFLVINCSSVQLIPTTVIALRAQAGAAAPADIILPTLIATAVSTAAGILALKLCRAVSAWRGRRRGTRQWRRMAGAARTPPGANGGANDEGAA